MTVDAIAKFPTNILESVQTLQNQLLERVVRYCNDNGLEIDFTTISKNTSFSKKEIQELLSLKSKSVSFKEPITKPTEPKLNIAGEKKPALKIASDGKKPALKITGDKKPVLKIAGGKKPALKIAGDKKPGLKIAGGKKPALKIAASETKKPTLKIAGGKKPALKIAGGKKPALKIASSETKKPALKIAGGKKPALKIASSETKKPALKIAGSETKKPALKIASSETKKPALKISGSETKKPELNATNNVETKTPELNEANNVETKMPELNEANNVETKKPEVNMVISETKTESPSPVPSETGSNTPDESDEDSNTSILQERPENAVPKDVFEQYEKFRAKGESNPMEAVVKGIVTDEQMTYIMVHYKELKKIYMGETINDFQKFYTECTNAGFSVIEQTIGDWKGPVVITDSDTKITSVVSVPTVTIDKNLGFIVRPEAKCDPSSVIYEVDPENDFEITEVESEVEVDCIPWIHEGTEYILDEVSSNVYKHDSALDVDEFVGKRVGKPGSYTIDDTASED